MVWVTGLLTTLLILAADFAAPQPVEHAWSHVLLGIACLMLAPAFAALQAFVTTRRWAGVEILDHRAEFLHRSLLGSNLIIWLFGCVGLLVLARWPQLIRHNWHLGQVPLIDELALALPMIGSVLLSWLVIYDAEKALRVHQTSDIPRTRLAFQRLRTFSGLVLVPIAILFLARDFLAMFYPQGVSPVVACMGSMLFLCALLSLYPVLLSLTWKTRELADGLLGKQLQAAAAEAGLPSERLRVWDTDSTVTNAVVAGIVPGLRRVFLSDQLLERFEKDEVVAIYRHELGHLVHQHLPMRVALMLVPLLALMALAVLTSPAEPTTDYSTNALQASFWLLGGMAFLGYISQVVTRFVRKSEIQADLFAICRSNGRVCLRRADAYCRALLKMAAQSPELFERSTAAHPSIKLRVEVIRQVIDQPQKIQQFHRKFRQDQQVAAVCLMAFVLAAVAIGKMI